MSTLARTVRETLAQRVCLVALLALVLAMPRLAWTVSTVNVGVTLRGTAFSPAGGEALRLRFRLMVVDRDTGLVATGLFDCRPRAGFADACPGHSGTVSATFGYQDVNLGPVSSARIEVSFGDGSSCVFSGVSPLAVLSAGSSIFGPLSPIVSIAGNYACQDAQGAPSKSGDFFTSGGPAQSVPKCKGAATPLCRTL